MGVTTTTGSANTYTAIATTTLASAASSYTFSSISSAYTDLVLIASGITSVQDSIFSVRLNSDSGTNYSNTTILGYNGSGSGISGRSSNQTFALLSTSSSGSANQPGVIIANFLNYSNTTTYKTVLSRNASIGSVKTTDAIVNTWRSTAAINTILIYPNTGTFSAGSTFTLYGIKAA